jgi:hypothetical protein
MFLTPAGADGAGLDERLADAVARVEAGQPGLRVIAARLYRLPCARVKARLALQSPRRFNILEEFILRAANDLQPPPTPGELSSLLGLDPLFVDSTLAHLESLKTVARGAGSTLTLTPTGRKFYTQGQVPQAALHKTVSLQYRGGLDTLTSWAEPTGGASGLPLLPGITEQDRENLAQQALAALTAPRLRTADGGRLLSRLAEAEAEPALTGVDQAAVEDVDFGTSGVLVVQDLLAGDKADNVALRAIDPATQADDTGLQAALDAWLKAGRVKASDFLPAALDDEASDLAAEAADGEPLETDYAAIFREQLRSQRGQPAGKAPREVALLRAGDQTAQAERLRKSAQQRLLLLVPRLNEQTAGELVRRELRALAERGVLSIIGWGTADERDQERVSPPASVVEALHGLYTAEGLPAAPVWWVGQLYGQDVLIDGHTLISTVANTLFMNGQRVAAGTATYVVTGSGLVQSALEELEPPFARAARVAWHSAAAAGLAGRAALERCCVTWVAVGRPGEALSHILKLASSEPDLILVAWELFTVTCLALARLPAAALEASDILPSLRRALPEFLDWADSAPAIANPPPFIAKFHDLLLRYATDDGADMGALLAEAQTLWQTDGLTEGKHRTVEVFTVPEPEGKTGKLKKRRY